jgi:hypothetical protein
MGLYGNRIYAKITRQTLFDGENNFKSQAKKPPKPFWRGKTSAGSTSFPVKTLLAGNQL